MTSETRTIQTWPSGISYEYHGRPEDGPTDHRSLRILARNGGKQSRWRRGAADEWTKIIHSLRAERYSDVEIYCCDSSLVDNLLKQAHEPNDLGPAFTHDAIRNLYPDPGAWDAEACREWLTDHGHESPPLQRLGDSPQIDEEADEEVCRTEVRDHAEPAEVYEWWRVSEWLCRQLHAIGEVTIDNDYGHWWGRCCTGQGYLMDGVLQRVAAQFD